MCWGCFGVLCCSAVSDSVLDFFCPSFLASTSITLLSCPAHPSFYLLQWFRLIVPCYLVFALGLSPGPASYIPWFITLLSTLFLPLFVLTNLLSIILRLLRLPRLLPCLPSFCSPSYLLYSSSFSCWLFPPSVLSLRDAVPPRMENHRNSPNMDIYTYLWYWSCYGCWHAEDIAIHPEIVSELDIRYVVFISIVIVICLVYVMYLES